MSTLLAGKSARAFFVGLISLTGLMSLILIFIGTVSAPKVYASGMLGIEVKGGAYFQNLSGHLKIGNSVNGYLPTNITPSDIGLQTVKTEPMFKVAFLMLYDNRISFTYVPYVYKGSRVLSKKIYFNGKTYDANTDVTSQLDLHSYKMFYTRDFDISSYVSIGLGVGVDLITVKTELNSLYATESKEVNLPIPLMGVRFRISPLNSFSFIGRFQGFTLGSTGYYYHVNVGVDYKAIGPLSVFADYVYDKVHVDTNSVDGSLEFKGPEAGLKLRF